MKQQSNQRPHQCIAIGRIWVLMARGGDSAYEGGGDARRKFWIKPPKETDLGVAQAFFDPEKRPC